MRFIAITLSLISIVCLGMTMHAGLKTAHGGDFFIPHLHWGFITLGTLLLTLALCLMFIFKMHGIIHDLVRQLDEKS